MGDRTIYERAAVCCRCHATSLVRSDHDRRCPFWDATDLLAEDAARATALAEALAAAERLVAATRALLSAAAETRDANAALAAAKARLTATGGATC